jgi:hypothetical protein
MVNLPKRLLLAGGSLADETERFDTLPEKLQKTLHSFQVRSACVFVAYHLFFWVSSTAEPLALQLSFKPSGNLFLVSCTPTTDTAGSKHFSHESKTGFGPICIVVDACSG